MQRTLPLPLFPPPRRRHRPLGRTAAVAGALLAVAAAARAVEQTQSFELPAGWSAVWLEVAPIYDDKDVSDGIAAEEDVGQAKRPEDVFANEHILLVASPLDPVGTAEFVAEVSEASVNGGGWSVWHRSSELSANTLGAITGNRAYLVLAEAVPGSGGAPLILEVPGEVSYFAPSWVPDRYNLLGFPVLSGAGAVVSFDQFFGPSGGRHRPERIFRLGVDGVWSAVAGTDEMVNGEAYWVFADGPSRYMGPVALGFEAAALTGSLDFGVGDGVGDIVLPDPTGAPGGPLSLTPRTLTLSNLTGSAVVPSIAKFVPAGGSALADELRLFHLSSPDGLSWDYTGNGVLDNDTFAAVPAGASAHITLGAHRQWAFEVARENLYQVSFGTHYFWLPATAESAGALFSPDTEPAAASRGLWVGEVVVDEVSNITTQGSPVQATTSRAPFRILLHADGDGAVSLLSSVYLLQERTASEDVPPALVLVTDPAKIPFFEGVEERGGRRVGRRIDAVAYDLPRKVDAATQVGIAAALGGGAPSEFDILNYINGRSARPVALVEDYHQSWPMFGGLGGGKTLQTLGNLHLDRFHRSNPFRHAFHRDHVAGLAVQRSFSLTFDGGGGPASDRLEGDFQETLTGLVNGVLTARGRIVLRRVSTVAEIR